MKRYMEVTEVEVFFSTYFEDLKAGIIATVLTLEPGKENINSVSDLEQLSDSTISMIVRSIVIIGTDFSNMTALNNVDEIQATAFSALVAMKRLSNSQILY